MARFRNTIVANFNKRYLAKGKYKRILFPVRKNMRTCMQIDARYFGVTTRDTKINKL